MGVGEGCNQGGVGLRWELEKFAIRAGWDEGGRGRNLQSGCGRAKMGVGEFCHQGRVGLRLEWEKVAIRVG